MVVVKLRCKCVFLFVCDIQDELIEIKERRRRKKKGQIDRGIKWYLYVLEKSLLWYKNKEYN